MAARKRNRENEVAGELALVEGPVAPSCLGDEVVDEAMLLDGYDAHLQLLENRPKTTAGTYRTRVRRTLRNYHERRRPRDIRGIRVSC